MTPTSTPRAVPPRTRFALAAWLAVIALVGGLRFIMKAFDNARFEPDAVAWLWLAGGTLATIGAIGAWRHARR